MKNRNTLGKIIVLLVFIIVVLSSCSLYVGTNDNGKKGNLEIQIGTSGMKTLLPETSMVPESLRITGNGPFLRSYHLVTAYQESQVLESLAVGSWDFNLACLNAQGDIIGEAQLENIEITENETSIANATIVPVTGMGNISLTVHWDTEVVTDPVSLSLTLTNVNDQQYPLEMELDTENGTAEYTGTLLNGYYDMHVIATYGSKTSHLTETVRILAGQTTTADLELLVYPQTSDLDIHIVTELDDPIEISFTGAQSQLSFGQDMTIQASTNVSVDSYTWYLDGLKLTDEQASSITLGSNCFLGNHILTLRVKKGNVLSSESIQFSVITDL